MFVLVLKKMVGFNNMKPQAWRLFGSGGLNILIETP